ncbi:MAG TPA: VOC family protein, partial [Pyrinomonadaceae bacterium]|nr:VOC family protein [Pyrinomonadaceae bacterium]
MRLTVLKPLLWTEDFKASVDFYVEVLGFMANVFNEEWGFASLSKDDVSMMLSRPNERRPYDKIGLTGSFYFTTDDVDSFSEELKDKARICYGIENFFYGMREF